MIEHERKCPLCGGEAMHKQGCERMGGYGVKSETEYERCDRVLREVIALAQLDLEGWELAIVALAEEREHARREERAAIRAVLNGRCVRYPALETTFGKVIAMIDRRGGK